MSDIFIKGDINDLITSVESDKIELPQWLNIVDAKDTATSENAMTQINDMINDQETSVNNSVTSTAKNFNFIENLSVTSDNNDVFISQMGGDVEKALASPEDINSLINMITTENFDTVTSITNTSVLENQLKNLLDQTGGAKKTSKKLQRKLPRNLPKRLQRKPLNIFQAHILVIHIYSLIHHYF